MKPFMYHNPTKLLFGKGQLAHVAKEISRHGNRVLLVYGGGSIKRNGVYDEVVAQLKDANITWHELPGVASNPKIDTVRAGAEICKREQIDFVLAVGGGSVIDATKAIIVAAKADVDAWDIISRKVRVEDGLPYGSVVTLAGTGAEMSLSSVISNEAIQEKRAWVSSFSRAKFAIVDPTLMTSVPKGLAVNGVVDTMSHLLEHYFHTGKNTNIQDEMLEAALRNVIATGTKLVDDLTSEEDWEVIAFASTLALSDQMNLGFIGDWGTHHIEHALSAVHDVPHAGGMAILFPQWMEYVLSEENVARFKRLAIKVLKVNTTDKSDMEIARAGITRLAEVWKGWGAPTTLADYDVAADSLPLIAKKTLETAPNCGNFQALSEADILRILEKSL